MQRRLFAILILLLFSTATFAQPKSTSALDQYLAGVKKRTLPNGLTVITREVPGSGVVAINTWVKAGYFHEPDEVAGMAHLFEHMFFKGSKKFPGAEQISEELSAAGGRSNAGTIYDTTNYYFLLPKENLRRALEIQADAIANPLFDANELKKESEVVIEESNRKRDNPPAVSSELMYATAFTQHRFKRWRIGSNEVLRNINRDNLLAFFDTLYRPQNMILVVAGDITHDGALQAINDTFGKIPKGTLNKRRGPVEPPQNEFRFGQSQADLRQGYTVIGFQTGGIDSPDEVTLDVLAAILGQGRSSRFFRNVVGPAAASTASAGQLTFEDIGMLEIDATFDEKNRAEVERRLIQEIERLKSSGPTDFELQLAKNRVESSAVLGLEDVLNQAQTLGQAETRGGYMTLAGDLRAMQTLTAKDITEAARKYLTTNRMTLYQYRPKGAPETTREAALQFVNEAIASAPETQMESVALNVPNSAVKSATGIKTAQKQKLANGATLIVEERAGAPIVSAGIYFRRGRSNENSANAGITSLMTRSMRRGTSTRAAEQIDREIEFLGTQIATQVQHDSFGFSVTALTRNFRSAFALVSDVVLNPTFPEKGVAEDKHLQKASMRRGYDSAIQRPSEMVYEAFYRNHPYALPADGYVSSVDAITPAALRDWWERHVVADDAVIVIVGDIAAEDAVNVAQELFGNLRKRTTAEPTQLAPVMPAARSEANEFRDRKQSAIGVAFPTVPITHPDWVHLRMLQQIGSGLSGTLFNELRSKRSLAYTVFGRQESDSQAGLFYAYLAGEASKEAQSKSGLVEELRRMAKDAVTDENVARAKSALSGSIRINMQTNTVRQTVYGQDAILGLGLDNTQRVLDAAKKLTADELRKTAEKYFATENYVMAVVKGNA